MKQFILLVLLFLPFTSMAQEQHIPSHDHRELLVGEIYQPVHANVKGHPFLFEKRFMTCTLFYQNKVYSKIRGNYNLYRQSFIYYQQVDPSLPRYLQLNPGYVDRFILEDSRGGLHLFRSNVLHPLLPDHYSYYEVMYENSSLLYIIAWSKRLVELPLDSRDQRDQFTEDKRHFIVRKDQIHEIKNRRDILKFFPEKKKALRKFIRGQGINYSLDRSEDIVSIIKYYVEN